MSITANEVNRLRKMTGAGMMDCKHALVGSDGDFEKAISLLRKKGRKVASSRANRMTSEGVIFAKTNTHHTEAMLLALTCETDFVAKNNEFIELGEEVIKVAAKNNPSTVQALESLPMGSLTVLDKITELTGKVGEKIQIANMSLLKGEKIISYVHSNAKIGVLVALKNINGNNVTQVGKDVAMQIAAMNPVAIDKKDIDEATIAKEMEIGIEQARREGKPENLVDKIAQGKLNKFFQENTLLNQTFVKDNSKTVAHYLNEIHQGLTVVGFKRVSIS